MTTKTTATTDMFIHWSEEEVKEHQRTFIKALRSGDYKQGDQYGVRPLITTPPPKQVPITV